MAGVGMPGYKRVLLKLSGEALAGDQGFGVVPSAIQHFCDEIIQLHEIGTEIAVVIGGGSLAGGEGSILGTLMGALIMCWVSTTSTRTSMETEVPFWI